MRYLRILVQPDRRGACSIPTSYRRIAGVEPSHVSNTVCLAPFLRYQNWLRLRNSRITSLRARAYVLLRIFLVLSHVLLSTVEFCPIAIVLGARVAWHCGCGRWLPSKTPTRRSSAPLWSPTLATYAMATHSHSHAFPVASVGGDSTRPLFFRIHLPFSSHVGQSRMVIVESTVQ